MDAVATLTMNPTIDVTVEVARVDPDEKLRTDRPRRDPGGGGVNVARALARMGVRTPACFPAGGPTGKLLRRLLEEEGVPTEAVDTKEATRENFTAKEEGGRQYRFVMPGPELTEEERDAVLGRLGELDPRPRWLVASGSLPPGVPDDFYARLSRWAGKRDIHLILDSSGDPLREALDEGVHLVKPNARELGQAVGRELDDEDDQVAAARELVEGGGARVVVVSLGASGALVVTPDLCRRIRSPSVRPESKVGAGDSAVAGLVRGLARGDDLLSAARLGMAAGAAAVKTPGTELCRGEEVERLYRKLSGEAA